MSGVVNIDDSSSDSESNDELLKNMIASESDGTDDIERLKKNT